MNRIRNIFKKIFNSENTNKVTVAKEFTFEDRMRSLENYFKRNIENSSLFEPEYLAAKQINLIAFKKTIMKEDLDQIIQIYNNVNSSEHYNGSGWMDFRLHIQGLIKLSGLDFQILENRNLELL